MIITKVFEHSYPDTMLVSKTNAQPIVNVLRILRTWRDIWTNANKVSLGEAIIAFPALELEILPSESKKR